MSGRGHEEDRARHLMMAALDGELGEQERAELDRRLAEDAGLRTEWVRMQRVKEITETMGYREPPEEVWEGYWASAYNRVERGFGWVLVSLGALAVSGWATWRVVHELLEDTSLPGFVKIAVFSLAMGLIVLAISVLREKLFTRRGDPYREIQR